MFIWEEETNGSSSIAKLAGGCKDKLGREDGPGSFIANKSEWERLSRLDSPPAESAAVTGRRNEGWGTLSDACCGGEEL